MAISNDAEFKAALEALDVSRQRKVAAAFVEGVLHLCHDVRTRAAVELAKRGEVSEGERVPVCQAANSARVDSFTQCGKETDWQAQAGHFVARAAFACVRQAEPGVNLAWDAAMAARMARTCEAVAEGKGTETREAENQFRILSDLLNA